MEFSESASGVGIKDGVWTIGGGGQGLMVMEVGGNYLKS